MGTLRWGHSVVFLAAVAAFGPLRAPPASAAEPQDKPNTSKASEPTNALEAPEPPPKTTKTSKTQAPLPSPSASDDPQDDAVRSFEEGVKAAKAEDWPSAERAFRRAWSLRRHWQIAANLGRAELMNGRHCDAAEHLSYVLNEAKDLTQTDRARMRELLDKGLTQVGLLAIEVDIDDASVRESVYLRAGSTRAVALRIGPARWSTKDIIIGAGVAATAVTAALGAASLVYAFTSLNDRDAANKSLPPPGASPAREEGAHQVGIEHGEFVAAMNIGVASLIAGGAFGVTTLIYGIAAHRARAPSADTALSLDLGIGESSGRFAVTYVF